MSTLDSFLEASELRSLLAWTDQKSPLDFILEQIT